MRCRSNRLNGCVPAEPTLRPCSCAIPVTYIRSWRSPCSRRDRSASRGKYRLHFDLHQPARIHQLRHDPGAGGTRVAEDLAVRAHDIRHEVAVDDEDARADDVARACAGLDECALDDLE